MGPSDNTTFEYVNPTDEQLEVMNKFRVLYQALYNELSALPINRGVSFAKTELTDSAMWLNRGITGNC